MSKEESSRGGLLSKVVRFVRNPTVDWSALDKLETERESQYSKDALKELMERKRRNDFVRRREFAQLRQLRQRGVQQPQCNDEPAAVITSYLSELSSPGERAATLQKIDAIEAQMSQQWWKGAAHPAQAPRSMASPDGQTSPPPGDTAAHAFAPTEAVRLPPVPLEFTGVSGPSAVMPLPAAASGTTAPQAAAALSATQAALNGAIPHPTAAPELRPAAMEPEKFVHAPELEEAAIRFAQADFAGAEKALQEALAQSQQAEPAVQEAFWLTLFDLYRATGQAERFDALAIDFAARFGRSAPLWVSLPEQLGLSDTATGGATGDAPRRSFAWSAPHTLTAASLLALRAALERAPPPWTLNWARLTAIAPEAVPQLTALCNQWAEDCTVQLVCAHAQVLHALLAEKTPSGERSAPADWWLLRMACLRLMGRVDEFELVALDYCVTYEVSPPAWAPPRCSCIDGEEPHATDAVAQPDGASPPQDMLANGASTLPPLASLQADTAPTLSGQIEGDCSALLPPLEAHLRPGEPLVIDCAHLIRMDFAAAGTLLNWAAEQQAKGQQLQFDQLHRLVAILFNVLGINEHAWVVVRKK